MERKVENLGVEAGMNTLLARFPNADFIDVWVCWEQGVLKYTARVGSMSNNQQSGWGISLKQAVDSVIDTVGDWNTYELTMEVKKVRDRLCGLEATLAKREPLEVAAANVQVNGLEVDRVAP